MTEQFFTDHELNQIHKFSDSSIMHEASSNPVFDIPELTEDELKRIKMPDDIEVPKHINCKCEYIGGRE